MNIIQLEYLVAAATIGSFAGAARFLHVTPQAISQSISDLKKELRIELFVKSGRGIELTDHGNLIASKALEIIQNCGDLKSYAKSLTGEYGTETQIKGNLSLAVSSSPYEGDIISRSFFASFKKKHPSINLTINHTLSGSCLSALQEGVVDSSIVLGRTSTDDYVCTKIFDCTCRVALSKQHPLATRKAIGLCDIKDYPIAKPHDLRYCVPAIKHHFSKANYFPKFVDMAPFIDDYNTFFQDALGILFVTNDASLKKLYLDTIFLPLKEEESIKIPICFVYKKGKNERVASFFQKSLLEAKNELPQLYWKKQFQLGGQDGL